MVHWKLCEKFNLEKSENWYLHNPETVTENINHKLIWDMNIQCENVIVERSPDTAIDDKIEKTAIIIDVAIPGEKRIIDKKKRIFKCIRISKKGFRDFGTLRKMT